MRHNCILIILLLVTTNVIGQTTTETLYKKNEDSTRVICRDCSQGEIIYYFDGKKIDISKLIFTLDNIKSIEILPHSSAIKLTGDSAKASVIFIKSKRRLRLWTLNKLLFKNSIDTNQIDKLEIFINDKQIQETNILIDSKARVIPVYKKNAGQTGLEQHRIICGALIYTTPDRDKK